MKEEQLKREEHWNYVFLQAYSIVDSHRVWFRNLTNKYNLIHPAVRTAYIEHGMPRNWQTLLLEWPHQSETDANRLAYTPNEKYGEADRQVITSIGKYLNRAFDLPDHVIRDIVARHSSEGNGFKFLNTTEDIVDAVQRGPYSCMCWRDRENVRCHDGERRHPYEVYTPKYGWHMAVRTAGNDIVGRALCNKIDDKPYWVRSYKKDPDGGYSYADEFLEAWLKSQGYEKRGGWAEGTRMEFFPTDDEFLVPYLDGDERCVAVGMGYLEINPHGDYECDRTDGSPESPNRHACDECGETHNEDELHWVEGSDVNVCESCLNDEFTYVIGRRGNEYYVRNDYAVYVESEGQHYDEDYLSDNGIVRTVDNEYDTTDNLVYIESEDEWYPEGDDRIVYDEHNECYELVDNCIETEDKGLVHAEDTWMCEATEKHYSDNEPNVHVDGHIYHPDHVPETNESNEE